MKFCFVCGKKTDKLIEGYCEECYNKKFNLIDVPDEVVIKCCSKCGKIKSGIAWKDVKIPDVMKNKIKIMGKDVSIKIDVDGKITVKAKGFLEGSKKQKQEQHEVKLKMNKITCPDCSRRLGGYYEAIIQIRGDVEKALNYIDDELAKEKGVYKIERDEKGADIYLDNTHLANKFCNMLKKRFNAKVRKSYRLVTRKEGKDIYRSSFVVRI